MAERMHLFSLLVALGMLAGLLIVHTLSWFHEGVRLDLVNSTLGSDWRDYGLQLVMVEWVYYIWLRVYLIQVAWIVGDLVNLCRREGDTVTGSIQSSTVYVLLILSLSAIWLWIVIWDSRIYNKYSIICASLATVFACLSLFVSVKRVRDFEAASSPAVKQRAHSMLLDSKAFIHNGIALLAAWNNMIIVYSLLLVLHVHGVMTQPDGGYIALAVIVAYFIILFAFDLLIGAEIVAHILSPYCLWALVLSMAVYKHRTATGKSGNVFFILGLVGIAIVVACFIGKLIVSIFRYQNSRQQQTRTVSDASNMSLYAYGRSRLKMKSDALITMDLSLYEPKQ